MGLVMNKKFQKADQQKNMMELIDPAIIVGLGKVLTFGSKKYEPNNWKKAQEEDIERIKGALLRHLMAYLSGEKVDPETELSHLYHITCNCMFLDYFDRADTTSEVVGKVYVRRTGGFTHKAVVKKQHIWYDLDTGTDVDMLLVDFIGGKDGKDVLVDKSDFLLKYSEVYHDKCNSSS